MTVHGMICEIGYFFSFYIQGARWKVKKTELGLDGSFTKPFAMAGAVGVDLARASVCTSLYVCTKTYSLPLT